MPSSKLHNKRSCTHSATAINPAAVGNQISSAAPAAAKTMLTTEMTLAETPARISTPVRKRAHAVERDVNGRRLAICPDSALVIARWALRGNSVQRYDETGSDPRNSATIGR